MKSAYNDGLSNRNVSIPADFELFACALSGESYYKLYSSLQTLTYGNNNYANYFGLLSPNPLPKGLPMTFT